MGDADSAAIATGSILVVGVAVLGSLTVLPAVLAKLGDRVHKSRLPLLRRLKREERDSRVVGLRPRPRDAPPARGPGRRRRRAGRAGRPGARHAHEGDRHRRPAARAFPVLKTYDRIEAAFPAQEPNAYAVVKADDAAAPAGAAPPSPTSSTARSPPAPSPRRRRPSCRRDRTVALVQLPLAGDGSGATSRHALDHAPRAARPGLVRLHPAAPRSRSAAAPPRPWTTTPTCRRTPRSCSARC